MDNTLTQNMQPDLFPVLSEIPKAKRNCRLRCQGEAGRSQDTSGRFSIRLLETLRGRSCQPAFPPLAPATGNSAAATRPRAGQLRAHLPGPLCPSPGRPAAPHTSPLARGVPGPCYSVGRVLRPIRKGGSAFV